MRTNAAVEAVEAAPPRRASGLVTYVPARPGAPTLAPGGDASVPLAFDVDATSSYGQTPRRAAAARPPPRVFPSTYYVSFPRRLFVLVYKMCSPLPFPFPALSLRD